MFAQDLIDQATTYLQQTGASIVAGLPSGLGESDDYLIAPTAQMLLWLTEGQNRVARLCLPIYDTATFSPEIAGAPTIGPYTQVVSAAGRLLHRPSQLYANGRQMSAANMGFLNSTGNWYPVTPGGDPTGWADNNTAIALSSYTTTPVFTINGYFLPRPLIDVNSPVDTFIDDYAARTVAWYCAGMMASKNMDNTVLAERIALCGGEWIGGVKEIYTRLIENDPSLDAFYGPEPIDALVQIVKQISPRT